MSVLTKDILKGCKDLQGGVNTFYVIPWQKYSRSQIILDGQSLVTYPTTIAFEVYSNTDSFTETSSFEGGAEKWDQTFTFDIPKTEVGSELYKLLRQNIVIFYVDRLNNIRVLGLYNGLECQITNETGTDKPSLNGYRVSCNGLEDNQAYFIDDLEDIGIVIGESLNYIFQDGNNKIFQDGNNAIMN